MNRTQRAAKRRTDIASHAKDKGSVSKSELALIFGASESTIAGDLQVLVHEGKLVLRRRGSLPAIWIAKETKP